MALTKRVKAGYGSAEFGLSAAELLLQFYLLEFYVSYVGLNSMWVGVALGIAVLWDAFSDPLMGAITDHTKTRFGRFIPYLVGGGFLFGISLMALFNPPNFDSQLAAFFYLLIAYLFVNTGLTVIGVPHMALGGALSKDTHERTELYGWRLGFGTLGFFAGILAPLFAAQIFDLTVETNAGLGASRGYGSIGVGLAIIVFAMITVASTWKSAVKLKSSGDVFRFKDFYYGLGKVFSNRMFLPVFVAFLLVATGRAMNSTLALPYYKVTLKLQESQVQQYILGLFSLCIVLSVPLWVYLGKRFGKKNPGFVGLAVLGVMTVIVYPMFPQGTITGPMFAAVIGGVAVGAIILFESIVTDIADWDLIETGEEREGLYFGFWRMGQKLMRSVTLAGTGWMLNLIGFQEGKIEQSEETARNLAYLFGPGVGTLFIAAAVVFFFTPMSKSKQEEIQERKQKREKQK